MHIYILQLKRKKSVFMLRELLPKIGSKNRYLNKSQEIASLIKQEQAVKNKRIRGPPWV